MKARTKIKSVLPLDSCSYKFKESLYAYARADPGFLERRFIFIKVWGFALLILSNLT